MSGGLIAPVVINNALKLNSSSTAAHPMSAYPPKSRELSSSQHVTQADITGTRNYKNADGEVSQSKTFIIRSLKIGNIEAPNVKQRCRHPMPRPSRTKLSQALQILSIDNSTQELILKR